MLLYQKEKNVTTKRKEFLRPNCVSYQFFSVSTPLLLPGLCHGRVIICSNYIFKNTPNTSLICKWTRQRQTVVLYSPLLLDTGILLLADLTLELQMDYPSETSLCTVAPSPTDTPSPIFSEGRGRLYTGYQKRIIHLQTVRQN